MFYPRPLFSNPRSVVWLFNSPQHRENCCSYKVGAKTGRALQLIYFFKSFRISRISHNYAIPHAMPHAIPQTLSPFYPHRSTPTPAHTKVQSMAWANCHGTTFDWL